MFSLNWPGWVWHWQGWLCSPTAHGYFQKTKAFSLARQQSYKGEMVMPAWPGQAYVEDLGCFRAIVIQWIQPVQGRQESWLGRKEPSAQGRACTELSQSTLILHFLTHLSTEGEGCKSTTFKNNCKNLVNRKKKKGRLLSLAPAQKLWWEVQVPCCSQLSHHFLGVGGRCGI